MFTRSNILPAGHTDVVSGHIYSLRDLSKVASSQAATTRYVANLLGGGITSLLSPREIFAFAEWSAQAVGSPPARLAHGDIQSYLSAGHGQPDWTRCKPLRHVCHPPSSHEYDIYKTKSNAGTLRMPDVDTRIISRFGVQALTLPEAYKYALVSREYAERVPMHHERITGRHIISTPIKSQCLRVHRYCCQGKKQKIRRSSIRHISHDTNAQHKISGYITR